MRFQIYLAGPISGCTYKGCTEWREAFKLMIQEVMAQKQGMWHPDAIQCLSPMRAKDYLDKVGIINDDYPSVDFGPLSCSRGIMTRDRFDCTRADLIVANLLGADRVSVGTCMEFGWADANRIPIIGVMEKEGNLHDHPMVREAIGFRVETLEQAAHTAVMVLWPHA